MNADAATLALQRAWSLWEQGERAAAREAWESVSQAPLRDPAALQLFGALAIRLQEPGAARVRLQKAVRAAPDDPQNHLLLGLAQQALGQFAPATQAFRNALRLRPGWSDAAYNLSRALEDLDRNEEAISALDDALQSNPDDADLWNQRGLALASAERFDESLAALKRAVELEPGHGPFRVNLGQEQLRVGDARGWEAMEARLTFAPNLSPPRSKARAWQGEALDGRSILIWDEQGLGDAIQFARWAPELSARGATVRLRCRAQAVELMRSLSGVESVWNRDGEVPETDFHLPVGSLPWRCGAKNVSEPEGGVPAYLHPTRLGDADRAWLHALGPGVRIGLAWTGNPAHVENRRRTLPAKVLRSWMDLPGVQWISLQRGGPDEPAFRHPRLAVPGAERLGDLARTAAWLQALDLTITVDSLPVHLAGSVGAPAWLLLDRLGDWRWGRPGAERSLYGSVRVLRQRERGDWAELGRRVAAEIANGDLAQIQRLRDP